MPTDAMHGAMATVKTVKSMTETANQATALMTNGETDEIFLTLNQMEDSINTMSLFIPFAEAEMSK